MQFQNNFVPAQETTQIQYQANLPSSPPALLNGASFQTNPVAGAQIVGTGATLLPDAVASGTGTVSGLTSGTALINGDTYTVSDGTNTTSFTAGATSTLGDLMNTINAGAANVRASLVGGAVVLTGTTPTASITVGGTAAAIAAIGFGAGHQTFPPTDLLTQGAVTQNQTLTVSVGGGTPQTITFGTGANQVATLAELQTAIQNLTGVIGSVDATGDISLTATNSTANIVVGGTANAANFGIQNTTAFAYNGTVIGNDLTTFNSESIDGGSITAYDADGNPVNVDFRWAKVSSATTGGTDAWQLFYQTNSNATGTPVGWLNAGTTFTFNAAGEMKPAGVRRRCRNLTVEWRLLLGNVQVQFGNNGLTQFASSSTTAQVSQLQQNGFASGQLQSVAVDSQNRVGRHLHQRPDDPARRGLAGDLQRREFAAGAQRRRLCGHTRIRPAEFLDHRQDRRQLGGVVECRHRHPVQPADRGAASLFGQCAGDDDRQPDDPEPAPGHPVRHAGSAAARTIVRVDG